MRKSYLVIFFLILLIIFTGCRQETDASIPSDSKNNESTQESQQEDQQYLDDMTPSVVNPDPLIGAWREDQPENQSYLDLTLDMEGGFRIYVVDANVNIEQSTSSVTAQASGTYKILEKDLELTFDNVSGSGSAPGFNIDNNLVGTTLNYQYELSENTLVLNKDGNKLTFIKSNPE